MNKSRWWQVAGSAGLAGLLACGSPEVHTGAQTSAGGNGQLGGGSGQGGGNGANPGQNGNNNNAGGFTLPDGGGNTGSSDGGAGGGPAADAKNCGLTRIPLEKRPADLMLVLDRSGSMVESILDRVTKQEVVKWTATVSAIDPVVKSTQGAVSWGLKMYPVPNACAVPEGATVNIAPNNHGGIMAAINATVNQPVRDGGSTPTRDVMKKATALMKASTSSNAKYLLLATDGLPNCRENGRNADTDEDAAVQAVADAAAAGIPTFVVGIATSGSDAHETLNRMADKGGRARTGAVKYYSVGSRAELSSALETITGQISSCTFPLSPAPPNPNDVAVDLDGTRIPRSDTQGWSYGAGNASIVLTGAGCDSLKAGNAKDVQIIYGCPGVVIP